MKTLKHLRQSLDSDLLACRTFHEQVMVKAIAGREIRELARVIAERRPLSLAEFSIASEFGFKGQA